MSGVGGVSGTAPVGGTTPLAAEAGVTSATLPQPSVSLGDGKQDMLAMIYASMAALEKTESDTAQKGVTNSQVAQHNAEHARDEALRHAREEAEKGGFFDTLAKDIGVVGVVGLATFNYAAVAVDVGLHESGLVKNLKLDVADGAVAMIGRPDLMVADVAVRKLDIVPSDVKQRLDAVGLGTSTPGISDQDVKPITKKAIEINLLVAGTAASVFTAGSTTALVIAAVGVACSAGGYVSSQLGGPTWLSVGLDIAGCAASVTSGFAAPAKVGLATTAAKVAAGTSAAAQGADTIVKAVHEKASDDANADAMEARHSLLKLERLMDQVIDGFKDAHESNKRVQATVQNTMQIANQTLVGASSWKG